MGNYIVGLDCCEQFVNFIMDLRFIEFQHVYAHNGGNYDNLIIM